MFATSNGTIKFGIDGYILWYSEKDGEFPGFSPSVLFDDNELAGSVQYVTGMKLFLFQWDAFKVIGGRNEWVFMNYFVYYKFILTVLVHKAIKLTFIFLKSLLAMTNFETNILRIFGWLHQIPAFITHVQYNSCDYKRYFIYLIYLIYRRYFVCRSSSSGWCCSCCCCSCSAADAAAAAVATTILLLQTVLYYWNLLA